MARSSRMRIPPTLPLEFTTGAFSVREAAAAGIPEARLRRSDLSSPFRGIRTADVLDSPLDRCLAYAPRLRAGQVFSHLSAAVLWGVWLPQRLRDFPLVDVLALAPAERPRAVGVRGHRARHAPIGMVRGVPVVEPPALWLQLGAMLEIDELIAAGDSLVRRKNPPTTLNDLERAVAAGSGRGIVRVRRALPSVRAMADSARETRLRLVVVRAGLPEPEVNGVIVLASGDETHGDLVFREWRVLVEYDGGQHRTSGRQFEKDVIRLEELAAQGWIVIRVLAAHLEDERAVVARVVRALRSRGWRGRMSRGQFWRNA